MKKIHFTNEKNGFYGVYWKAKKETDSCLITMIGDDAEDHLAKETAEWLMKQGVNVLTLSVEKKDYSYHNYPLERIENAIDWLKLHGNQKIGIAGASTTGTFALVAASYFPSITLTIALTPSDFVWQGFMQGKRDGYTEWPVLNESLFTFRGKQLPYMPFCYQHPHYGKVMKEESRKNHDMLNSIKIFEDSEKVHPIKEEEFIKIENIKGKVLLIGAEDDCLWNTSRYILRMKKRLEEKEHSCKLEAYLYAHGTHFVFPQSLIKKVVPVFSSLFVRLAFSKAKGYSKECKMTRIDIDKRMKMAISSFAKGE